MRASCNFWAEYVYKSFKHASLRAYKHSSLRAFKNDGKMHTSQLSKEHVFPIFVAVLLPRRFRGFPTLRLLRKAKNAKIILPNNCSFASAVQATQQQIMLEDSEKHGTFGPYNNYNVRAVRFAHCLIH